MAEALEVQPRTIFDSLATLPLEPDDVTLIERIVRNRLQEKGITRKPSSPTLNKLARDIFRISHERNEALGSSCCPDPEWNMLLDLVIAHTECRQTYISSLCIASGVPTTTALRHIERMETVGLVRRKACDRDKRRIWVEPTAHTLSATELLLRKVYEAGRH